MESSFAEGLKVFLENHFYPTIISLVIGVVGYIFTPVDNSILIKLGREWYILLCSGVVFLLISLVVYLYEKIQKFIHKSRQRIRISEYDKKEEQENMHLLWDYVDSLSTDDRDILIKFLETNNSPIEKAGIYYGRMDSLLNSEHVKCREINSNGRYIKQYILDENFYKLLKYSKEKYGKISNFE